LDVTSISFGPGELARLGGEGEAFFLAAETWIVQDDSKPDGVRIAGYRYALYNRDRRELLSYHWHQSGPSPILTPHLHVGCRAGNADLSKVHLPTGPVTLVDVIRCGIAEFGVQPLRADWGAVLDRADQTLAHPV
jgi:hypothetical protein